MKIKRSELAAKEPEVKTNFKSNGSPNLNSIRIRDRENYHDKTGKSIGIGSEPVELVLCSIFSR